MSSSADNKTCCSCSASLTQVRGQAIFTAECSHAFHFSCISSYISGGGRICPICSAPWNTLPPLSIPVTAPLYSIPAVPFPFQNMFIQPTYPPINHLPRQRFPPNPISDPEPRFRDDEPLPVPADINVEADDDLMSIDLEKLTIKAVPEHSAVAASESANQFAVLVGLKAPSLLNDARSSQRAPIDIVTVLDVSGSMRGTKLSLVKKAMDFVIDNLGVSDRLSIVSFSDDATRVLPLRRMTEVGREDAKRAVDSLVILGGTNIAAGLKKGVRVLEERCYKNPVTGIIFLSDGNDTCNLRSLLLRNASNAGVLGYEHPLPASIFPGLEAGEREGIMIPVHSFGFGSDHDPITMHTISEASGGTFSFIETYEMVQDAFAGCIGGLMSVVAQEVRVNVRAASHGVEITSIPSGRYRSEISCQGAEGLINVGELYADEEKEFLINLSIPVYEGEDSEGKTSVLDITCSYKDAVSKQTVVVEGDLVEVRRPMAPCSLDLAVNIEVDRQRNRLRAAESIKQAQKMAEAGDLAGATKLLAEKRSDLMATVSARAGDGMTKWLESELKETEMRMGSERMYQQSGRAYTLAGMSSHAAQRATSRGGMVAGAPGAAFGGYATPQTVNMVSKSQLQSKEGEGSISK